MADIHEHAEHAAHAGSKKTALLIAVIAALLALSEAGGKEAQTEATDAAIAASDTWNFYQAKSLRRTLAASQIELTTLLPPAADPALEVARQNQVAAWRKEIEHYDDDPVKDNGRRQLETKAAALETVRDHALGRLHGFEKSSAALQLAIVLATASVITGAVALVWLSVGLAGIGAVIAAIAFFAPSLLHHLP